MTENKAIRIHIHDNAHRIEALKKFMENNKGADERECKKNIFVLEEANRALLETQQYRSIGTVEECREAREKQRAKKPNIIIGETEHDKLACCPICERNSDWTYNGFWRKGNPKYCSNCGQKLDWSDTE